MLIFIIISLFVIGQANSSSFYDDPFGGKHLVEANVDKLTAYVNEQVTYTFSYYHIVISPSEPQKTLPSFAGFLKKEPLRLNPYWKNIGSERYRVEEIKVALFPITTGKIRIEPAILGLSESDKKLTAKPITLTILPLPEIGKPKGFTGAVGSFELTAHIDKDTVEVGQSITLTVNINGEGDIDSLPEPEIPELVGFTKYEPEISKRFMENTYEIRGEKIYEYVFVPTIVGQWQFSPIQLPYFEPNSKTYQIARAQPIEIHVIPGTSSRKGIEPPVQRDIRGGRDIQHIKPANVLFDQSIYLYQRYYFWVLQLLPVLAIAGAFIYKKRRKQQQNSIPAQQRKTIQNTEIRLEQAKTLMNASTAQKFFDTLAKILQQYIAEMLNISPVGLTTASISSQLTQKGIPEITRLKLVEVLQQCDYGRFAPATLTLEEMQQALNAAKEVIEELRYH
jgi:hypothetical protein